MDQVRKVTIRMRKIARKKIFAEIVAERQLREGDRRINLWKCCNQTFQEAIAVHKHISHDHAHELMERTERALCIGIGVRKTSDLDHRGHVPKPYKAGDVFPWLPAVSRRAVASGTPERTGGAVEPLRDQGQVLLFYRYVELDDPDDICSWQEELCARLQLTGKIRIAREGLNGTVGGPLPATRQYIQSVLAHPAFMDMKSTDFKKSEGGSESFPEGLVIAVHQEIVPMGKDPRDISYRDAGQHLTPSEFHTEIQKFQEAKEKGWKTDTVFVDCRNFYESRIGAFADALRPDIRKFSYWPEYVDKNEAVFADKRVLMYCTGGIRCERGSAYLKSRGICKEVLQLEGGIHRYLEQYSDGFFRGKLFVFDDRYSIQTNQEVIAECFHCPAPWDRYQPCTSEHCHQLVLSCPTCRDTGLSTCCLRCAELAAEHTIRASRGGPEKRREECSCTKNRERIPIERMTTEHGPADTSVR